MSEKDHQLHIAVGSTSECLSECPPCYRLSLGLGTGQSDLKGSDKVLIPLRHH